MNTEKFKELLEWCKDEEYGSIQKEAESLLNVSDELISKNAARFLEKVVDHMQERRDDGDYVGELEDIYSNVVQSLYSEEELKKANAELAEATKAFKDALDKAENIATKYGLSFGIHPAYGMGGHFSAGGWSASSQGC